MFEKKHAPITAGHYGLVRVLLGAYLLIHFLHLLPYGKELFSSGGVLPENLSPLPGIIPDPLTIYDAPVFVSALLLSGAVFSLFIVAGSYDRVSSLFVAVLLGWLYARNPLIANPSLTVVGWMLLAHSFVPPNAYGKWSSRGSPEKWAEWFYPRWIWIFAWIVLAIVYTYSGYTKLLSPSWVDGSAIRLVLENPLARDHVLRTFLLELPPVLLQLLTWSVLLVELLFALFCLANFTRKWAWIAMLFVQLGFLTFLNFADLTFPMLLIHALTFDRGWVNKYRPDEKAILFFDGSCAFCSGIVRFALSEDFDKRLEYSPLQGATFPEKGLVAIEDDSIAVLRPNGETLYKSDAAIYCFEVLGGVWLLFGKIMKIFPKKFRDKCYDLVGRIRYRLAGKVDINSCRLLPAAYRDRILP